MTATRQPAAFEAVILHELAHIRNKDVNQTYLAIAIWRAFVLAALLPLAGLLTLATYRSRRRASFGEWRYWL